MVEIFRTNPTTNEFYQAPIEKGVWINLISPTEEEIDLVVKETGVMREFIYHSLDVEERARLDQEDGQFLIIVDIPSEGDDGYLEYVTIPLGIIVVRDEFIITVCSEGNLILDKFKNNKFRGFATYKKTRFVFQIFHTVAEFYLRYLKYINRKTDIIEKKLHQSMKNEELFNLLSLEKSLVYFTTSLKSNEIVMEKVLRLKLLNMYQEDEDVLEDAIVENKQAIEMAHIYSNILSGMMDAFASVISNNLNMVMKFLTSITIVLTLPTMVASFFGMNVELPFNFGEYDHAFMAVIFLSFLISTTAAVILAKKKLF
jgi:magnesium transporter